MVVAGLSMGGLETIAFNCMKYTNDLDLEFDFLVYGDEVGLLESMVIDNGGKVIHMNKDKNYFTFYKRLKEVMKTNGPYDVVHSHTFFSSGIVLKAANDVKIKNRIAHIHSVKRSDANRVDKKIFNYIMRKLLLNHSTSFCACSNEAGNYVFTENVFSESGIIIPNSIDIDKFKYSTFYKNQIRKEFDLKEDQVVIGQIGRLDDNKNQKFMLEILKDYNSENQAKLLLVGDGKKKEELINYARALNIEKDVIFCGVRKDAYKIYSAFDVFVCTSKHEGFGIVLLEAQANSLPCVIEQSTLVEEIRKLENCIEVKGFENIQSWSLAINEALKSGRSKEKTEKLKKSIYSGDRVRDILENLYDMKMKR